MNKVLALVAAAVVAVSGTVVVATQADASSKVKAPTGIQTPVGNMGSVKTPAKPKAVIYGATNAHSINDITWKSWGPKKAVGFGVQRINNCKPNCAESESFTYTEVVLTASQPYKGKFTILGVENAYTGDTGWTTSK
jgi:hypothetical protein